MIAPPLAGKLLGADDDADFVIAEWSDPGGHEGERFLIAPYHVHHRDDEAWYVLEGTLVVQVGEDEVEVPAGSGVLVPRGTAHTYWNPKGKPARYLLVMTPNIHRLIQGIHAMSDRSPAALSALFEEHSSSLLPYPGA